MSEDSKNLAIIQRTLRICVRELNSLHEDLINVKNYTLAEAETRVRALTAAWTEYRNLHSKLVVLQPEESVDDVLEEFEEFQQKWIQADSTLNQRIKKLARTASNSGAGDESKSSAGPSNHDKVRLPKLNLPTFSGRYEEWASFHDLFTVAVHNNDSLTNVQKLQYLKGCVTGEASNTIRSVQITEANYEATWQLLIDRYFCPRLIVFSHLRIMFNYSSLHGESATGLRRLLDTYLEHVRALRSLREDRVEVLLAYLLLDKLDPDTRKHFELSLTDTETPTFEQVTQFLQTRCRALEVAAGKTTKSVQSNPHAAIKEKRSFTVTVNVCPICTKNHNIYKCESFMNTSPQHRFDLVKQAKLCLNCLKPFHRFKSCKSASRCKVCQGGHHSLLHFTKQNDSSNDQVEIQCSSSGPSSPAVSHFVQRSHSNLVVLPTALICVRGNNGELYRCRALLDNCSQCSFITEQMVNILGYKRRYNKRIQVTGIGSIHCATTKGTVSLNINSRINGFSTCVEVFILPKLTGLLPQASVAPSLPELNITLADPNFHRPGPIDILLGAPITSQVFLDGRIPDILEPGLVAQNTSFGWVITGSLSGADSGALQSLCCIEDQTDEILRKFWECEEVFPTPTQCRSEEEKNCEAHFVEHSTRNESGQFVVRLPVKGPLESLGDSRQLAEKRLLQFEKRASSATIRAAYNEFMSEYLAMGHMERVLSVSGKFPICYLPHHPVLKLSSSTTRLRVVFNASAKTDSGVSLNDLLMKGPKLQENIFNILVRFRTYAFAFAADISKMYRRILVNTADRELQRILWRAEPSQSIEEFRLNTVTYGTTPASYLAQKCLFVLADSVAATSPTVARVIRHDFYMDDLLTGASTLSEALTLREQVHSVLLSAGFPLRKYASNSEEILKNIPHEYCEMSASNLEFEKETPLRLLGLRWEPKSDTFIINVELEQIPTQFTKRLILSEIARIFDPLGFLSPVTIKAKILLQSLWLKNCDWDHLLGEDIVKPYLDYRNSLASLNSLRIPRCVLLNSATLEIHGFCDASERAFCAVIYARAIRCEGIFETSLLCAKTKVAPIRVQSIPRYELSAALLLANLMEVVRNSLRERIGSVHAWTDSTVVLSWLSKPSCHWRTYVATRVSKIIERLPIDCWGHVRSEENPADLGTRGIPVEELIASGLWINGPVFLSTNLPNLMDLNTHIDDECELEKRAQPHCLVAVDNNDLSILDRFSSLNRAIRVVAYCLRFISRLRSTSKEPINEFLMPGELENSLSTLIRVVQQAYFRKEFERLRMGQNVPKDSVISTLNPFLDEHLLLRVGGRLSNAAIAYEAKHPMILPRDSRLTYLIACAAHIKLLHASQMCVMATLRRRYWIIGMRSLVRKISRECVICLKRSASTSTQQLMGSLPANRVNPTPPFYNTGCDFAGPFATKASAVRSRTTFKSYLAIFVCFVTKAVHLELVGSLSAESFIACLRRFVARRGCPKNIYTDNGTNFVGAKRQLSEMEAFLVERDTLERYTRFSTDHGIKWHFIPPGSPNFGGLWEAAVKCAKRTLFKVMGHTTLTYEELNTLLIQIEDCLNSRPLTPVSDDPDEIECLTPNHFLRPNNSGVTLPQPEEVQISLLRRWRLIQQMTVHYWNRWRHEYLCGLQQRQKWLRKHPNLEVGRLVILKEDGLSPGVWRLGRVTRTFPGTDGIVRVAEVRTKKGVIRRPVSKFVPLPAMS